MYVNLYKVDAWLEKSYPKHKLLLLLGNFSSTQMQITHKTVGTYTNFNSFA